MGDVDVEKDMGVPGSSDSVAALVEMHDNMHAVWRRCVDEASCDLVAEMHADVVNRLLSLGAAHPGPPPDGLDATLEMIPLGPSVDSSGPPSMRVELRKSLGEQRLVYGVVLEPMVTDAHNEWERPETIERTAHSFLARYNAGTTIGFQHRIFGDIGVELVESYIAPQDLDFDGELAPDQVIRKGSWVMVVHVLDDTLWAGVKAGTITGFSVGGVATILANPG